MSTTATFKELNLPAPLLEVLVDLGYETSTPVQSESIPVLMDGKDILAQAQTGTGKTAAFALPILARIDLTLNKPQALVIAPTRELAIQVAEAFQSYSRNLKGFHVAPIYGGQDYQVQLRALKRGTHVIVGTPGRVMDHLRRGTLDVKSVTTLVLDEADEMLKMGFIDDVEWILEQIPHKHQTALFSATLPASIQKIANRYLKDAVKIQIKSTGSTVDAIEQAYMRVSNKQKLDVLTRYLEIQEVQAAIIFTRTKNTSDELAEKLQARGYAAAALNGDMSQALRKKSIDRIKRGDLDIVVATDVAARGIDIDRISHVINYDIPHDTESYIHRIGRTGRAGRTGKALLFVNPNEQRLLKDIERAIGKPINQIEPPTIQEMTENRSSQLAEKIMGVIKKKSKQLQSYHEMIDNIREVAECTMEDVAAALVYLTQQANPMPSTDIVAAEPAQDSRGEGRSRTRDNRRASSGSPRRSFSGGRESSDRPRRSFSKDKESSSERPRRSFSKDKESPSDRPRRTFSKDNESSSERPRRSFVKDKESSSERPRRSFSNDKESSSERPRRSFVKDKESSSERPRRSFVKGNESSSDRPRRKDSDASSARPYAKKKTSTGAGSKFASSAKKPRSAAGGKSKPRAK